MQIYFRQKSNDRESEFVGIFKNILNLVYNIPAFRLILKIITSLLLWSVFQEWYKLGGFTLDDCHNIKKRQNWKSVAFLVCLSVYKSEQTVAQSLRLNNLTYRKLWWYSLSSSKSVNTPFKRYFMILALKQHFRVPKSAREGSIANCTPLEF